MLEHSHRIVVFYDRAIAAVVDREEATMEVIGALMAGKTMEQIREEQQ